MWPYVTAAFSPDGTHVASGSCDQHVHIWQVDRPREPPVALKGHSGEVTAVVWCPTDFGCLVGAYTPTLLSSSSAVSDTKCTNDTPYNPLPPPKHPLNTR